MTMYGRIQPDQLGRPSLLWLSKHAQDVMGQGPYAFEADGDILVASASPSGRRLSAKARTYSLGRLLDNFNHDGKLTNEPFPIKRGRDGEYHLLVRQPDPSLSSRNNQRITALPMQVVERTVIVKQEYSTEEFVRLFALAQMARASEALTEADFTTLDDLLAQLPKHETILSRFGSLSRFDAFVDFQYRRLKRGNLTANEAYERLQDLLNG